MANSFEKAPESIESYLNERGFRSASEQEQIIDYAKAYDEEDLSLEKGMTASKKIKKLLNLGIQDFKKVLEESPEFLVEY